MVLAQKLAKLNEDPPQTFCRRHTPADDRREETRLEVELELPAVRTKCSAILTGHKPFPHDSWQGIYLTAPEWIINNLTVVQQSTVSEQEANADKNLFF